MPLTEEYFSKCGHTTIGGLQDKLRGYIGKYSNSYVFVFMYPMENN